VLEVQKITKVPTLLPMSQPQQESRPVKTARRRSDNARTGAAEGTRHILTSKTPSLKSASGSGFSFEDKVAAGLMAEILAGQRSLGSDYGVATRIERQANDW
jgi:hypothetical protein